MLECFKSHHKNHVCQLACWFEELNALYHWIESLLLPQSFFLKHRVYVSILPLSCVKQVHISSTAFNYLALQIHLLWFSYCHFGCLCNSCHLHSSVVLLVHYLYSFDQKNKYISGQLMDGLFNWSNGNISSLALVKYCPVYLPWPWDTLVMPAFIYLKV